LGSRLRLRARENCSVEFEEPAIRLPGTLLFGVILGDQVIVVIGAQSIDFVVANSSASRERFFWTSIEKQSAQDLPRFVQRAWPRRLFDAYRTIALLRSYFRRCLLNGSPDDSTKLGTKSNAA
jgi:hypothetical protein